jgi:hypothetical protein
MDEIQEHTLVLSHGFIKTIIELHVSMIYRTVLFPKT